MSDLQGELKDKVLTPEQEINNAINYKVKRGPGAPPTWVMRGKLAHRQRLIDQGYSVKIANEKIGVSHSTADRWKRKLKGLPVTRAKTAPNAAAITKPRRVGKKIHSYEPSFRKAMAEKAMAMLRAGEIVNISEAGPKLGVSGTTLNGWCRKLGLIEPRRRKKSGVKPANGALPIDLAVKVFDQLWPERPQSRMKFENALLRAVLESKV